MLIDQIHAFEKFMQENERPNDNQSTKETPAPESIGTGSIRQVPCSQLVAHSVAYPMCPDQRGYTSVSPLKMKNIRQ